MRRWALLVLLLPGPSWGGSTATPSGRRGPTFAARLPVLNAMRRVAGLRAFDMADLGAVGAAAGAKGTPVSARRAVTVHAATHFLATLQSKGYPGAIALAQGAGLSQEEFVEAVRRALAVSHAVDSPLRVKLVQLVDGLGQEDIVTVLKAHEAVEEAEALLNAPGMGRPEQAAHVMGRLFGDSAKAGADQVIPVWAMDSEGSGAPAQTELQPSSKLQAYDPGPNGDGSWDEASRDAVARLALDTPKRRWQTKDGWAEKVRAKILAAQVSGELGRFPVSGAVMTALVSLDWALIRLMMSDDMDVKAFKAALAAGDRL